MKATHKLLPDSQSRQRFLSFICAVALLLTAISSYDRGTFLVRAQESAVTNKKRPLTHQDYDSWRSIQAPQISRDGKFVAYAFLPQDGDGEIIIRNIQSGTEWRVPRGYRPPVPPPDDPGANIGEFRAAQTRLVRPLFTADSRHVIFSIEPGKSELNRARKEKKKPEEMPRNALGIADVTNGEVIRIERVKNFQVPEDGKGFVAYLLEPRTEDKKAAPVSTETKPAPQQSRDQRKKEFGSDLVLRSMADGSERTFNDVLEYTLSNDARTLVFTVSSKNEEANGVYAVTLGSDGAPLSLLSGKGKYQKLTWDEDQTQLAFISDKDDASAKQPRFKIYHWERGDKQATEIVSISTRGFRKDFVISERANLNFSLVGNRLFLGTAPKPEPEPNPEEGTSADEKVIVDLWHWKDDYIQPMQRVRAQQERHRSYRAVYHLKDRKFVQLADETMETVVPSLDGRFAVGADNRHYRTISDYSPGFTDYYLVNTADGTRKLIVAKQRFPVILSPNARYGIFFDGKDWNSYSTSDSKVVNLTRALGTAFHNEDHDTPSLPGPYGLAGWTKDDALVLIYDRFDIWQIEPDGSGSKNLTDGTGRKEKTRLRYVRLDPKERWIDPGKAMLLQADNEETRDSGFYRDKVNGALPEKLLIAAKDFGNPVKAKDADVLMLNASRFDQFPDLWVTNGSFSDLKRLSDGDAQRVQFNWGTAELVRFKNADGVPLKGILFKPEDFDPNRQYPMLVYIYERLSQGLHSFRNPGPGTSINVAFYVSNGYLVFMPDIVYTIGYPGHSAVKCVLPGVQAVVDKGFVDEDAIGIQGHSWGGYQIAYMVTQTNRFRAAAPGALVSNMTSAYSGIRWGTGLPRQFQYEQTQSRIGGSLWEFPMRFLENSPVFRADRVQTPLLMLHNDQDDAVPWYQGIEFYLALRRLGKEVYMFNYNGEKHGLRRRINQKDYTRRLQEFFDYHLKGTRVPEWAEKGIPFLQREKEKEKYRTTESASAGQQ